MLSRRTIITAIILLPLFHFICCRTLDENSFVNTTELDLKDNLESIAPKNIRNNYEKYEISEKEEETTTAVTILKDDQLSNESDSESELWDDSDYAIKNAVHLDIELNLNEVLDINETDETITLDMSIGIFWNVSEIQMNYFIKSLQYEYEYYANPKLADKIWIPGLEFGENTKLSKHPLISDLPALRYDNDDKRMEYESRESFKFNCQMDFKYYPADIQQCNFTIYDETKGRRVLMDGYVHNAPNLGDSNFNVQLISFEGFGEVKHPNLTSYEGFRFTLSIRRKISYHIVQTYIPSFLYILITCLCFLVPSHMVEVRMGISMTTLLTLTAMFASVRESTPTVSYVKAIDIWMAFCIFFVFLTLLEFTTLLWLRYKRKAAEEKQLENQKMLQALEGVIGGKCLGGPVTGLERNYSVTSLQQSNYEKFAEIVEKYGFLVFSLLFIGFVAIYWVWLIIASGFCTWQTALNIINNNNDE